VKFLFCFACFINYCNKKTDRTFLCSNCECRFAFLLIFAVAMQYFDSVHREPGVPHALQTTAVAAIIFIWFHPLVAYSILYATVGMVKMYDDIQGHDHNGISTDSSENDLAKYMVAMPIFIVSICLTIMRMMHKASVDCL
jgi:hypothetical protein